MAFEDAYLTIQDVDGMEWADKLRARMNSLPVEKKGMVPDERTQLLKSSA